MDSIDFADNETEILDNPMIVQAKVSAGYFLVKRLFDVIFSLVVTIVLLLPVTIIALVILVESHGNPFYSQERVGKGGRTIKLIKLRSMVADADNVEKHFSPEQLEIWQREHKVDNDPRITKVGKFIRRTSLDELPQFVNVLIGDMSIIGPRAITRDELEQWFTDEQKAVLLSVPQGITGWWQVQKRNEATFESGKRQQLELYYAQNASLKLDFEIFFRTFGAMGKGTGK